MNLTLDNSFGYSFQHFPHEKKSCKLSLFDLDGTLIDTLSGKTFPQNQHDWKWKFDQTIRVLKEKCIKDDFVCVISNQKGLLKKEEKRDAFMEKIKKIHEELEKEGIRMNWFVSFEDDYYRKPMTGSFHFIKNELKKKNIKIQKNGNFFCGDACGRSKDFSSSDLFFAHNCGFTFYTPEAYFLDEPMPTLHFPKRLYLECTVKELPKIKVSNLFFVMIVGAPASGKTFLAQHLQEKYGGVILESDKIKTQEKMLKKIEESLSNIKSVFVVGTYPKREIREIFLKKVKDISKDILTYGIQTKTNKDFIQHLNYFRVESSENKIKKIPDVAYRVYEKDKHDLSLSDGFQSILDYEPCIHFENKRLEEIYQYYY
jgi:bifunctional polynucleotide phosphatase/kinase